ncbi:ribonuclease H-like domain-containing protein [Jimgerdemannia flammicorona]|uniref:Ribonuclease n=1 Tax=Jimgerdemannia flammicorona TaxID=994334 RepID=A0A433QZI2_9FUNG|nr:ribonuclease H-like domain-containing protein [Jimgerdemannia flammicorona]
MIIREREHRTKPPLSYTHQSPLPTIVKTSSNEPFILGVDEAGRGPVLGPMVYSVCFCAESKYEELKKMGFADSKTLKEDDRDSLFTVVERHPDFVGWSVCVLSPQEISSGMLKKWVAVEKESSKMICSRMLISSSNIKLLSTLSWCQPDRVKYSLNDLAHDTTIKLIRETLDRGVNVAEIYVDTVGGPESYESKLSRIFPTINITVAKKADSTYPIVSAASICAKVTRDAVLRNWNFVEPSVEELVSREFGSGYPSDPNTVKWLKENMDPVFGYPNIVRFSWSTCYKLLESEAVPVVWCDDDNGHVPLTRMFDQQEAKRDDRGKLFTGLSMKCVSDF